MTLTYYQIRPEGDTNEANWETVAAGSLPQVVGSLSAGDYEVRALASSDWSEAVTVTATATATVPAAFAAGQWSVNGDGEVTLIALPADGGSTITSVEYQVDTGGGFGAWTALAGIALDTPYATTAVEGDDIRLRAVNAVGSGTESDTKTVVALRIFTDDFNRTGRLQDSPGDTWVETGAGTYTCSTDTTGADTGYCYADASNGVTARITGGWQPDQYCEVVKHIVNATNEVQGARAIVRASDTGDAWYRFHVRYTGAWVLEKNGIGAVGVSTLDDGTVTAPGLGVTYTERLEVVGNTLRGYLNGNLVVEFTDSSDPVTTGAPGMTIISSLDNRTWARALSVEAGEL